MGEVEIGAFCPFAESWPAREDLLAVDVNINCCSKQS